MLDHRREQQQTGQSEGIPPPVGGEISLLEILIVLVKHKRFVLGLPFGAGVLAALISLMIPNLYTGTTRILPPQQGQSSPASALLSQLGGSPGLMGQSLGIKNPSDLYVGMLKSRTVADSLIRRFDLKNYYRERYQSDARATLRSATTLNAGKDGIITIQVDDEDPLRAAQLANAYVEELSGLTQVLAITEASQRRLFFERQFAQAKDNLAKAETAARQALEKGGIVKVDDQGRAMVEMTARLRAHIAVKEIEIGAMRTFAADRNPELLLAQKELEAVRGELAKVEGVGQGVRQGSASHRQGIDNLGLLRDVKYYETVYELLAKQYELAKIDEAKDSPLIQVLDKAVEPDRKSKPKRVLIVLVTVLATLFLSVLWAFVRETMERMGQDPAQAKRLSLLRRYLRAI